MCRSDDFGTLLSSHLPRNYLAIFREMPDKVRETGEFQGILKINRDGQGRHPNFLKTVWGQPHKGSNPFPSAIEPAIFGLQAFFAGI